MGPIEDTWVLTPLILKPLGNCAEIMVQPDRQTTVGRSADCDVCIEDETVSRRHLSIDSSEGWWFVTDLKSTHGTSLSGERIEANRRVVLRDADVLRIGRTEFRVTIEDGKSAAPAATPRAPGAGTYTTRASIFLKLQEDQATIRELSWQEFHARYAPVIVGFARNRGLATDQANDVVQEVMMAFFKVSPHFKYDPKKGRFRGYLKRITGQVVAEQKRRAVRAGVPSEDADRETPPSDADPWERNWRGQIFRRALDEAGSHFEPKTMEAFDLFACRGVPAEEVARRLDMSVNSVHHAKSRVMKVIGEITLRIRAEEG